MTVSIIKTSGPAGVREAIRLLGGIERFISKGDKVILKPNICVGKASSTGVVTDPELVAETARMVEEAGGIPVVGESPIYPFSSKSAFRRAGYSDFKEKYGYEMAAFDEEEGVHVRVPGGKCLDHQVIARRVLQCDKLINMPVAKPHGLTTVTLALKNMKGVVPGKQKQLIHVAGLDEGIVDLNTIVKSDLIIIDGIIGLEGRLGPVAGRPVRLGVILASDNVVEADSTMCRIMGIPPEEVPHIRLAAERGLGRMDSFEILGEKVENVARKFSYNKMPGFVKRAMNTASGGMIGLVNNAASFLFRTEYIRPHLKLGDIRADQKLCNRCMMCVKACPAGAITVGDGVMINRDKCIRCYICGEVCPKEVFSVNG